MSSPRTPVLSVIVPCYNERATVAELLRRVKEVPVDKEIIVVDDASTDGSRDIVDALAQILAQHTDDTLGDLTPTAQQIIKNVLIKPQQGCPLQGGGRG